MKSPKSLYLILFLLAATNSFSQKIEKNQEKNRVIMVFTDDKNAEVFEQQIQLLKNESDGLKERRLVVFQVLPNFFNFNFEKKWNHSPDLNHNFNPEKAKFKVILIGLDREIKLEQTDVLSIKKLFALVDEMPMRKIEMKNDKH